MITLYFHLEIIANTHLCFGTATKIGFYHCM